MAPSTDEILNKYRSKIESQLSGTQAPAAKSSQDYAQFKTDMIPEVTRYERLALSLGNIIKINIAEKDRVKLQKDLDIAQTSVTASQAVTLSIISLLAIFLLTLAFSVAIYLITGTAPILFGVLGVMVSFFVFYYSYTMPRRLANAWRLQASSQMVPAILYLVVYMKHTSNLERAIEFTSQHLEGPLAIDFKKVLYDVQIGKYSTVKQSIDLYLEKWRDYAPEFIEAFHLIESSLYEPSESRRVAILEKSLQVILDGVYEKMLKYSRSIRSPLTNVYMLGIILPTLGLALLPLASALLQGFIRASHVFLLFNILVPFLVFYMASEVLLRRPGGYGETSLLEKNPEYASYISKAPWIIAGIIAVPLIIIGMIPFIMQIPFVQSTFNLPGDANFGGLDTPLFDFKISGDKTVGPFSPIAVLFSMFIPLGVGIFFATSYRQKTRKLIVAREQTKQLEEEFTNSLFQLGNRLGDGVPAEIAFAKVAESTQGQLTHDFFSVVNRNIQQSGMSVERAIFDNKQGAIIYYPSSLISTAMRILVESVKKGLQVAARSLMSISDYVKNIDKINQRLKDLLAEIVSDMKSNMVFLAPLLAGIVVGLSVMITSILTKLQGYQADIGSTTDSAALGGLGSISSLFNVTEMISPYFIQISIGLYIIEIIFILTTALVTIDAGKDPLREKAEISQNIKRGLILYIATAALSTIVLTILSSIALGSL